MVDYTNNVPQATQTIASTQPTILDNFNYIQEAIGEEHNMAANDTDPTHTYHLQASMPNEALSPVINAATDGVYFVSSGKAYFYDKTTNWNLNQWQEVITGTFNATTSSTLITAVPANVIGTIILYNGGIYIQNGLFATTGTICAAYSNRLKIGGSGDETSIELVTNILGGLNLLGKASSSTYAGTYNYKIFYRPA